MRIKKDGRKVGGRGGKEKRIGIVITRLSGHFASILYLNCEHFLFVYIVKQEQKSSRI